MKTEKNDQIQGLRAICCMSVVFFHAFVHYFDLYHEGNGILGQNVSNGLSTLALIAVNIFLILSGYFMFGNHKITVFHFLKKKFAGIYFPYLLCISLTFTVVSLTGLPGRTVSFSTFMANVFMVNGFVGIPFVDGAHWYFSLLLTYLLVSTLIYLIVSKTKLTKLSLVVIWLLIFDCLNYASNHYSLSGLLGSIQYWLKVGLFNFYGIEVFYFMLGICLREICDLSSNWAGRIKWTILAVIILMHCHQYGIIMSVVIISLIPVLLCIYKLLPFLKCKVFVFLGNCSYFIYLLHQNVIYVMEYQYAFVLKKELNTVVILIIIVITVALSYILQQVYMKLRDLLLHNAKELE